MPNANPCAAATPLALPQRALRACRRLLVSSAAAAVVLSSNGCTVHDHLVGAGPQGLGETSARQFYFLFGLWQLNDVDSQSLAQDRTAYRVVTEKSFTDWVLFPLLLPLTITSRTVTVYR